MDDTVAKKAATETPPLRNHGNLIYKHAQRNAEFPELLPQHWPPSNDEGADPADSYCYACLFTYPRLPGLVICSLLRLLGDDLKRDHDYQDDDICRFCLVHRSRAKPAEKCRYDLPMRIVNMGDQLIDGGWDIEEDYHRRCEICDVGLSSYLTSYGAQAEVDHFLANGPPQDGREWWELLDALEALPDNDERWKELTAIANEWGISDAGGVA